MPAAHDTSPLFQRPMATPAAALPAGPAHRPNAHPAWPLRWAGFALATLTWLSPAVSTTAHAEDDDDALFDPDADSDSDEVDADGSEDDPFAFEEPTPMTAVRARLALGGGPGSYSQEMPRPQALQSLSSGLLPVLEVSADVDTATADTLGAGGRLSYATTVGQTASVETTPGTVIASAARQQSVRGEFYLRIPLSDSPDGISLPLFFGAGLTGFSTDEPLPVVESTLLDVHLRPAVRVPLGPAEVELGPEAGFVLAILEDLPSQGLSSTGFSLGGQLLLDVRLSDMLALRLNAHYRQLVMPEVSGDRFFVGTWMYGTLGFAGYL